MLMTNLTLKNVPDGLHQRLKARAAINRRSLNREILALLETQLEAPVEEFVRGLPRVDHARVRRYRGAGRA